MTLKQATEKHNGLKFIVEQFNIYSSIGRKALLSTSYIKDKTLLSSKHLIIEGCQNYISEPINIKTLSKVRKILSYLNDISGTLNLLKQNQILDDVSLFEIKQFAIACSKIKSLIFDISKYLPESNKTNENLIVAGYLDKNLIYEKVEGEK